LLLKTWPGLAESEIEHDGCALPWIIDVVSQ